MLFVGISSGRKGKVTEALVRAVLAGVGKETEFVSLSGRLIRPCEACGGCVQTNRCVLNDDFLPIYDLIRRSDGLVFGAPTHWGRMNAKGGAFWERLCFSGRHNALFPLRDKPAVMAAVDGKDGTGEHVLVDLDRYFRDARLHTVGHVTAQGEYACFSCGYGSQCAVGGFAGLYPLGRKITQDMIPSIDNQHPHREDDEECAGCGARSIRAEAAGIGAMLRRSVTGTVGT